MLIRITGGREGIAEYLAHGQKQGRDWARDELDERVVLDGDLELTNAVIQGMEKEGERYLHITLAFKEDALTAETLKSITSDFKQFAMSAYEADEFNFYAEAHLPKIKSYTHGRTGQSIERKPHIHVVIPEKNLLNGQNLNPFGKVEQQIKFLEAFQEHANAKYGLASPKDHRRIEFTSESEMISRYKSDVFQGSGKALKERILMDMLDRQISDYPGFRALLTEHGVTRTRNAGQGAEYQNVKPATLAKGVNLKDYVFSREFIEKAETEKKRFLADEYRKQYESQQRTRATEPELTARLTEWHTTRALEIKYLNSGNRKPYAAYRSAERDEQRTILTELSVKFYLKYRKELSHERPGQLVADIDENLRAASRNIESTLRAFGGHQRARRNITHRRAGRVVDALGRRLGSNQAKGRQVGIAASQPDASRDADNVPGQFSAELRERLAEAKSSNVAEFARIKRELDARRLLSHLSKTHGVIPEKYGVTKGKDGADRITAGSRNLNVSDFLTQELRLSFTEAAPILRRVYAAQIDKEATEIRSAPRRELWETFRKSQSTRTRDKASEWDIQRLSERNRRIDIRDAYQLERRSIQSNSRGTPAERQVSLSIARMERINKDMCLREAVSIERLQLKARYGQPDQARYLEFLAELASHGDEPALIELRRQRDTTDTPVGLNCIEGLATTRKSDHTAPIMRSLSYSINYRGDVTYYSDATKRRPLVIDSGRHVSVASAEDPEAVEIALRLALQKFGPNLKVEGSEEFKRQLIETALKTGLRVDFSSQEMNAELEIRRDERDELQARGKAFVDSERTKDGRGRAMPFSPAPALNRTRTQPELPQRPQSERDIDS